MQTAEEVNNSPAVLAAKITIPPKSLILVSVMTTLPPNKTKMHFDFILLQASPHLGPNCIIYPLDYATIRGRAQRVLQALVNLGE